MQFEFTLLNLPVYIDPLQGIAGWIGWLVMLGLTAALAAQQFIATRRVRRASSVGLRRWLFVGLLALLPLLTLFLVVRLPIGDALPPPGMPVEPVGAAILPLGALPIFLAAGWLGAIEAVLIGALVGLVFAYWVTHNLFTVLQFALLAGLAYAALQQRYVSPEFRLLRSPLFTGLALALVNPLLLLAVNALYVEGSLAIRLDYSLTLLGSWSLAIGVSLILGGMLAEIIRRLVDALAHRSLFVNLDPLVPSPMDRSLLGRILYSMAPLALALVLFLSAGIWLVAGAAARDQMEKRLAASAQVAGETMPLFLQSGQNLIMNYAAAEDWFSLPRETQVELLKRQRLSIPFFNQMFLIDPNQATVASYPEVDFDQAAPTPEEWLGLDLALKGVSFQCYTIPPELISSSAEGALVSFIAAIPGPDKSVVGVLVGRAELASNTLTRSILQNFKALSSEGGDALLLDENARILYHAGQAALGAQTEANIQEQAEASFYEETAPDGTRRLVFFQPTAGYPWTVVLSMPSRLAQQLALEIAGPLFLMLLGSFLLGGLLIGVGLRFVTQSLFNLAGQANRISSGQLDFNLPAGGENEVGQLSRSFEQMRASLKARMDELNRLLVVSQGVASSLESVDAVRPVLEGALSTGASAARLALTPAALPDMESPGETRPEAGGRLRYGLGEAEDAFKALDTQIVDLLRSQDKLVINNVSRVRLLQFALDKPHPEAVLALPLRHKQEYYGALWLGFDQPRNFTEDEVRFITTLAGQMALAISNSRLFQNAEVGRERLASILASTPDPVLVTDSQDRLLLANPAARTSLGLKGEAGISASDWQAGGGQGAALQDIEKAIANSSTPLPGLVQLLRSSSSETRPVEVVTADQRVFLATASSVIANGRSVGRVCILRDITYFKELDAAKSDFVSTVSHDLRSPLTLIRGYATMLEMVGQLNEQQANYVQKIISGVDAMTQLVNNLLDLGRIEAGINLQLELTDVQDLLGKVITTLQMQANQKQINLVVDLPARGLPPVEADPALLRQALHNLIENALKYTDPGGKAGVSARMEGDNLVIKVSDTGIGIAPVDLPRLFEKFYRGAHRDARKRQGTGLGLAIVKSIAERHNGRASVESQLGKGSTFTIEIPLRQPSAVNKGERR